MINPAAKEQARRLYFQAGLTQKQIADIVSVNERTLFDWIKLGDWKRARAAATSAPTLIADKYYNQLARMSEAIEERDDRPYASKEEADIIRKLTMSIKQIKGSASATVSETIQFCMLFSNFMQKRAPQISAQVVDVMDEFINTLMPGKQSYLQTIAAERQLRHDYNQHITDLQGNPPPEQPSSPSTNPINHGSDKLPGHQTSSPSLNPINHGSDKLPSQQPSCPSTNPANHGSDNFPGQQPPDHQPEKSGSKPVATSATQPTFLGIRADHCHQFIDQLIHNLVYSPITCDGLTWELFNTIKQQVTNKTEGIAAFLFQVYGLTDEQIFTILDYIYYKCPNYQRPPIEDEQYC